MRGKKAKALRVLARYSVTAHRPELPKGGWISVAAFMDLRAHLPMLRTSMGTCVLPKEHPRHRYQFLKKRYGIVPLAHGLKRMHNSSRLVEAVGDVIQVREEAAA
jgi:hypothetical protein